MFRLLINTASSRVQAEESEGNNTGAQQYIELSDEDTGFQYTSLLFRFEDLEMTRSFNLSIPATPHNNAALGFSGHPAASGDTVTNEMGCTLLYDTGQLNGNISIIDYADGAYNACLTLSGGVSALRTLAEATDLKTALGSSTEETEEEEGTGTVYTVVDPHTLSVIMDWSDSASCRSGTACGGAAPNLCIQSYYTVGEGGGTFFDVCYGKSGFVAVGSTSIVASEDGKYWMEIYTTGREETLEASASGFYACAAYDNDNDSDETTYYVRRSGAVYSFTGIGGISSLTLFISGLNSAWIDAGTEKGYASHHAYAPLCVMGGYLYYTSGTNVYRKLCTDESASTPGTKLTGSASGAQTYSMATNGKCVYGIGRHGSGWYIDSSSSSNTSSGRLQSEKKTAGLFLTKEENG